MFRQTNAKRPAYPLAAKSLYLSQPSLSIQIKDLEEALQVPLTVTAPSANRLCEPIP
jgi:hypothetical protein